MSLPRFGFERHAHDRLKTEGRKDVLGIWIERTEGAKFWLRVMTEIKNRGVNDILIAIVDGLKGFPEAIKRPP